MFSLHKVPLLKALTREKITWLLKLKRFYFINCIADHRTIFIINLRLK